MCFEVADAFLVCLDDGIAVGIHDPVEQCIDLAFDQSQFALEQTALRALSRQLRVPQIAEHREGEIVQALGRLERRQERLELTLDDVPFDRPARLRAAARVAEIIRIAGAASFRPAGRQGLAAMAAGHETAQREVLANVGPRRSLGDTEASILHGLPCGKADDRLMLGRDQPKAPILDGDMTGIDGAGEDFGDALDMHLIIAIARERRLRFQKPLHLSQAVEATRGVALIGFLDDGGQRLLRHEQLAATGGALIAVADGRMEDPIPVHRTGAHPVLGLLCVLLALVL